MTRFGAIADGQPTREQCEYLTAWYRGTVSFTVGVCNIEVPTCQTVGELLKLEGVEP